MTDAPTLLISRCANCHGRFMPRPGPCPFCGSGELQPESVPARGRVLAATALESPAAGWTAPHRLVLVEIAQAVRLLAIAADALPAVDEELTVERDGDVYRVRRSE